jgi:hypothetical protein
MDRIECLLLRNPFSIYKFELATAIQMNSTHRSNRNGKEGGRKNASPTILAFTLSDLPEHENAGDHIYPTGGGSNG